MTAVMEREGTEVALRDVGPVTPMAMLQLAVQQGADLDKLQKLMDLQERWEKSEAKKAYIEAVAAFKKNPPTVYKDLENKQYNSRYTSIGHLVNTVNTALSDYGLSANWSIDQTSGIKITCTLTHRLGHSESTSMSGPPDTSGQKNPLQQIKSTVTYLKITTFEAIVGIASSNANVDDDGAGAGKDKPEPDAVGKKALEACGSMTALQTAWKGLTKEQRETLAVVKEECKARIVAAEKEAAKS